MQILVHFFQIEIPLVSEEILPEDMPLIMANREVVLTGLRQLDFRFITLDLQGFRSGSYDDKIPGAQS